METERRQQTTAEKLFCIAFTLAAVFLLLKYAAAVLLPFIFAWLVALVIYPLSVKTSEKTHIPRKLCAFVYVTLVIALFAFLIFLAVSRFIEESGALFERVSTDGDALKSTVAGVVKSFESLSSHIPFMDKLESIDGLENIRSYIDSALSGVIDDTITAVSARVPIWIGNIAKHTPGFFIAFIVTIMACYYMSMDYGGIKSGVLSMIPYRWRDDAKRYKNKASAALGRYARAYLLIMLITFTEVFIGLLILGRRYAFIMALIIALIDILPVLGAGTVLVPWAVIVIIMKNYYFGFGLFILYGVVTIVRQVIEPKIIGGSIGLHPLATLIAMFAGLRLFGIFGMIAGPAAALLIKEFLNGDRQNGNSVKEVGITSDNTRKTR